MSLGRIAQYGQAMTEFVVVAIAVLIPLFLIIPLIAKLISMKQDVELAARYAAWERISWYRNGASGFSRSDDAIAAQIDDRVFSTDTQAIVSSVDLPSQLDPFMRLNRTVGGELQALPAADISGAQPRYAQQQSSESEPDGVVGIIDGFVAAVGTISNFDLPRNGVFSTAVSVPIVDISEFFDIENLGADALKLTGSNTLFTESWSAGGNANARRTISGLLPQSLLNNNVVRTLQSLGPLVGVADELGPDSLVFGYVDIDPLPDHRLSDYGNESP